ncbi:MAG: hypothetical protein QXX55_02070, partial [Candidatus Pacearchaeota archaeon]
MYERENILRIFIETKNAISTRDSAKIKDLSNQTTNSAALTHDPDNIAAAVIVYSLSKIIERTDYRKLPGWNKFYGVYVNCIEKIIEALKKKNDEEYRKQIKKIRKAINALSGKLKLYILEVFRRASINKASRIYEHGISMERTAKLLGITLFELASYAGEKEAA